jgi:hypothetical protein
MDDRTREPLAFLLWGFDERSPDLFFEAVVAVVHATGRPARVLKLRRKADGPRYVVALSGSEAAIPKVRDELERQLPERYARFVVPASQIAPDATYGPETARHVDLRGEIERGEVDIIASDP